MLLYTLYLPIAVSLLLGCGSNSGQSATPGNANTVAGTGTPSTTGTGTGTDTDGDMDTGCVEVKPGWNQSFDSSYNDSRGQLAGGSEILHIVSHGGKLYAAAGYWMDRNNIWYGGTNPNKGWGQILRLDAPYGKWQVDLDMGPQHLRPEILKEITFTTDGSGATLDKPVSLLVASAYSGIISKVVVHSYTRNDSTGGWEEADIFSGPTPGGENYSVRGIHVHKDSVTGIDRVFVTIGTHGIFSGVYDPDAPGDIRWGTQPEVGPLLIRPLAVVEANGALLFSSGKYIYRRNDGATPTYTIVHDMSDLQPDVVSAVGGIRGLTAIPNPNGFGDSLIFVWSPNGKSQGHIYRLDPDGSDGFTRHEEAVLGELIGSYLPGSNPVYVLAAYNNFLSVTDPSSGAIKQLVGFEAVIGGGHPTWGNFYKGAMYAIRDEGQDYTLTEVNGPSNAQKPPLVAARSFALSPFEYCGDEKVIFFGGHDANSRQSDDMAWIFSTPLENALQ
jgi:poly(A) polymerase